MLWIQNNMAITRSQIPKQIEGKLRGARDEKKKKKRVIAAIKRKKSRLFKAQTDSKRSVIILYYTNSEEKIMTKLCPRGKAAAKRKFKVYPSAYA